MSLFLAWVLVMALAIASYAWLVILVLRASTIPRDWKWALLVPPIAVGVAVRAGGWPRAAAITFTLLAATYACLRVVA
jgi:hypothetical protein